MFQGNLLQVHISAIKIHFCSNHNSEQWTLVSVYGPSTGSERDVFVKWLDDLNIPINEQWLILGDFNFICSTDNRNKPGADMNDIFMFNSIISRLGLIELPLKARRYAWPNMQD